MNEIQNSIAYLAATILEDLITLEAHYNDEIAPYTSEPNEIVAAAIQLAFAALVGKTRKNIGALMATDGLDAAVERIWNIVEDRAEVDDAVRARVPS